MLIWLTVLTERYFVMKLQFLFEKNLPVKRLKKFCMTLIQCDSVYVLRIQQNEI